MVLQIALDMLNKNDETGLEKLMNQECVNCIITLENAKVENTHNKLMEYHKYFSDNFGSNKSYMFNKSLYTYKRIQRYIDIKHKIQCDYRLN